MGLIDDNRAVAFPFLLIVLSLVVGGFMYVVLDEVIIPTQGLYNNSSTIYSKPNVYYDFINNIWTFLPVVFIVIYLVYSQAQSQKRY